MNENSVEDMLGPSYVFEWSDGTTRSTKQLPMKLPAAIDKLVEMGEEDPTCTVKKLQ